MSIMAAWIAPGWVWILSTVLLFGAGLVLLGVWLRFDAGSGRQLRILGVSLRFDERFERRHHILGELAVDLGIALATGAIVGLVLFQATEDLELKLFSGEANLEKALANQQNAIETKFATQQNAIETKVAAIQQAAVVQQLESNLRLDNLRFVREVTTQLEPRSKPFAALDLRGLQLRGLDLAEADLAEADLTGADLTEANLTNADLTEAILTDADLSGAYLAGAHLEGAKADERTSWPVGFDWRAAGVIVRSEDDAASPQGP